MDFYSGPEGVCRASGAGLFAIATQCGDLGPQLIGTLMIASGDGHCQGKFKFFQLVPPFFLGLAGRRARRRFATLACKAALGRNGRLSRALAVRSCHCCLSSHSDIKSQALANRQGEGLLVGAPGFHPVVLQILEGIPVLVCLQPCRPWLKGGCGAGRRVDQRLGTGHCVDG